MDFKKRGSLVGRAMSASMAAAIFLGCLVTFDACQAQKKYPDPYHPKVRKIADRCRDYLEANPQSFKNGSICALALVEYYKRYDGTVPNDVPAIEKVVKEIAKMANGNSRTLFENKETYFPALAMILLAEYDSKKYRKEIKLILNGALVARQLDNGSFSYKNDPSPDSSQSQFGALAYYVARQHRIPLDPQHAKSLLQFYVDYQSGSGTWDYRPRLLSRGVQDARGTNSIHSASLSSVYLLADLLRLSPRVKKMASSQVDSSLNLPPNVTVYVPPKEGDADVVLEDAWGDGESPVVDFERARLASCKQGGKAWYQQRFRLPIEQWNTYHMYALERYTYFKEQAEGGLGGALKSWYDDGVDYLDEFQAEDGSMPGHVKRVVTMPLSVNTAFSLLFLVRASEVISLPPVGSELSGARGFSGGELRQGKDGQIVSSEAEKSLQGLIDSLADDSLDERQLRQMTEAMKRAVREFKTAGDRSRGEVTAFLRTMISAKNYYRRLVAIRFLAAEQDMDNVPALLYALGDPDPEIAIQAHNGLRLISRKFDTFVFEDMGNKDDNLLQLARLKQKWTRWFLDIRPNAELLE